MSVTRQSVINAIDRLEAAMDRDFDMLNTVDGALGDGDLGITMTRGMKLVAEIAPDLPEDLGLALLQCAQAFTKSSGSSYGTLLATGMMAIAKSVKGRTEVPAAEVSALVGAALEKMQARGKAELGGKTVLDSLDAIVRATEGKSEAAEVADAAAKAVDDAMDALRGAKATMGRARIFAEKSVGMDDPGMLAMNRIVKALANRED